MNPRAFNFIVFLSVGILTLLIANNAFFLHTHYLSDGRVITHAHPFKKTADSSPFAAHEHTKAELLFLENLQQLFYLVFFFFTAFSFLKYWSQTTFYKSYIPGIPNLSYAGRAPPFCWSRHSF